MIGTFITWVLAIAAITISIVSLIMNFSKEGKPGKNGVRGPPGKDGGYTPKGLDDVIDHIDGDTIAKKLKGIDIIDVGYIRSKNIESSGSISAAKYITGQEIVSKSGNYKGGTDTNTQIQLLNDKIKLSNTVDIGNLTVDNLTVDENIAINGSGNVIKNLSIDGILTVQGDTSVNRLMVNSNRNGGENFKYFGQKQTLVMKEDDNEVVQMAICTKGDHCRVY